MTITLKIIKETLEQYNDMKYVVERKEAALARLIKNREDREKNISKTFDSYFIGSMREQIAKKNMEWEEELKHDIEKMNYQLTMIDIKLYILKKECRDVIQVKYIEHNTWEYTSKHLGMSIATCRRRATEGIQLLVDAFKKEFEHDNIQGIA